jgi:hypothetical protein
MPTGARVKLCGRLQSRVYSKLENGEERKKTAFEISVAEFSII